MLAMLLLIAGLGFKIAAVPFHMWTPDAYQGAPTPVTAFMSVGPKAAGFAATVRIMTEALGPAWQTWVPIVVILSILTMTLGNVVAVAQRSVKRMLAYSSIAHTGYVLVGLASYTAANQTQAISSVLFWPQRTRFGGRSGFRRLAAELSKTNCISSFVPLGSMRGSV